MPIKVSYNIARDCAGDVIKINLPHDHNVDAEISHNMASNISGSLVNLNVRDRPEALDYFVSKVSKHFHELTPEQQREFNSAIEAFKNNKGESKQLAWLRSLANDLSVKIPGSVIAGLIFHYFGS